jgi:hypothetical protein
MSVRMAPVRLAAALLFVAGSWLGGAGVQPANAAGSVLTLAASARYDVLPSNHRVRITVTIAATNHGSDTVIRRFWFDHANLAVLPGTTNFKVRAVGSSAHPTVRVASRSGGQTLLRIGFGTRLYSGRTLNLRLTFDLSDPGGRADREVRVGSAIATFPVWAFGSPDVPGTVTVVMPPGFRVEILRGPLSGPTLTTGGAQVFTSARLPRPLAFFAYVLADRPGAYGLTPMDLTVSGERLPVVVQAWQDDAAFGKRTASLLKRGLPALGGLIGVPVPLGAAWATGTPGVGPLTVQEAVTRASGGYSALFDPAAGRIEVAYDASPFVVLHEASHAWFNGWLLADRWAAEGFASYYASLAAKPLKVAVPSGALTKPLLAAKVPLNAWQSGGAETRSGGRTQDAYAFAASRRLAELIAQQAGPSGLTRVWAAAAAGEMADQPAHGSGEPEREAAVSAASAGSGMASGSGTGMDTGPYAGSDSGAAASPGNGAAVSPGVGAPASQAASPIQREVPAPDWRSLLDLLETRTDATYGDLWRAWVVRPEEAALLDARATARSAFAAAVSEAGDWELPRAIRTALDHWRFDEATAMIAKARAVLAARSDLEAAATAAGLTLPSTLRETFERQGPEAAQLELASESAAIARIAADAGSKPLDANIVESIGLIGDNSDAQIARARTTFASGDLTTAVGAADTAHDAWLGATERGRGRLAVAAAVLAAFGLIVLAWSRRRRPLPPVRGARSAMARAAGQGRPDPPRPDKR